jgi:hypothetical protein
VSNEQTKYCCIMRRKIALGIAKVYSQEECGVSDSEMAEFHDFGYRSTSELPVAAALSIRFCPWCGTKRNSDSTRRVVEVIRPQRDL